MWPCWRESSHTVDVSKRKFWLLTLTVGEAEARRHVIFRDSCVKASNKEDGVDRETQPSHSNCPPASFGSAANLFAFQVFGGTHEECLLTKPPVFSLYLSLQPRCPWMQLLFSVVKFRHSFGPAEGDAGLEWWSETSEGDKKPPMFCFHVLPAPSSAKIKEDCINYGFYKRLFIDLKVSKLT